MSVIRKENSIHTIGAREIFEIEDDHVLGSAAKGQIPKTSIPGKNLPVLIGRTGYAREHQLRNRMQMFPVLSWTSKLLYRRRTFQVTREYYACTTGSLTRTTERTVDLTRSVYIPTFQAPTSKAHEYKTIDQGATEHGYSKILPKRRSRHKQSPNGCTSLDTTVATHSTRTQSRQRSREEGKRIELLGQLNFSTIISPVLFYELLFSCRTRIHVKTRTDEEINIRGTNCKPENPIRYKRRSYKTGPRESSRESNHKDVVIARPVSQPYKHHLPCEAPFTSRKQTKLHTALRVSVKLTQKKKRTHAQDILPTNRLYVLRDGDRAASRARNPERITE
ncbi:hypothetical protein BJ508DRAFT_300355 [Ascobolus immersus RN42]|uniref:Uncharacterized protein n=1 Tax=Ascobolus immersus RN42 TaxID=1160509 RepID=A0A3N4IUU2_ASCIM|nr:hypothetical protein BJ508DRAFT_300355 [Ascobolus immersus RN42]